MTHYDLLRVHWILGRLCYTSVLVTPAPLSDIGSWLRMLQLYTSFRVHCLLLMECNRYQPSHIDHTDISVHREMLSLSTADQYVSRPPIGNSIVVTDIRTLY